jgi:hypothetical protein
MLGKRERTIMLKTNDGVHDSLCERTLRPKIQRLEAQAWHRVAKDFERARGEAGMG